jgi:putative transposase
VQQRGLAEFLTAAFGISIRRACRVLRFNLSTYFYRHRRPDQAPLRMRLKELAAARVRYGYLRLHVLLRREGWLVNHKRVYRLYKLEGLSLRLKTPKKRLSRQRVEGPPATQPNECWSMDFISDRLASGHSFRALTLVDNFTRECPAIEVDSSLTGTRVAAVLEHLKQTRGVPARLKVDNGPEFTSRALDAWAHFNGVKLEFSRPGKPTDNPYIESFNGRLRAECLSQQWFETLAQAREEIENWRVDYNERRPHTSLGWVPPQEFTTAWQQARAG